MKAHVPIRINLTKYVVGSKAQPALADIADAYHKAFSEGQAIEEVLTDSVIGTAVSLHKQGAPLPAVQAAVRVLVEGYRIALTGLHSVN